MGRFPVVVMAVLVALALAPPTSAGRWRLTPGLPRRMLLQGCTGASYTVADGDFCYAIAEANSLSLDALLAANPGLDCDTLQVGQVLCLTGDSAGGAGAASYTVADGDTCYDIAAANGLSLDALLGANPGVDCNNLQVGQVLSLGGGTIPDPPTTGTGGDKVLVGYIGARGGSVPQFSAVPQGNAQVYLALSFATEVGDGNFVLSSAFNPSNDANLTPEAAQAAAQSGYKFLLALYGDQYTFSAPGDSGAFVANAVTSLQTLASQWAATGIELNVENGVSSDFVNLWCQIFQNLKAANPSFIITASPFGATWGTYAQMWSQCGASIDWFDYQLYADVSSGDVSGALNVVNNVASTTGWDHITIGFASNQQEPRGLQINDFLSLLSQTSGARGVNIWSMEDSYGQASFSDVSAIQSVL